MTRLFRNLFEKVFIFAIQFDDASGTQMTNFSVKSEFLSKVLILLANTLNDAKLIIFSNHVFD